jgi:peptide/nickel transport system permease protein
MLAIGRRTLHGLLLLAGVSVLSFGLLSLAPGNFYDELRLNPQISHETVEAFKAQYGLNQPLPMRYLHWAGALVRGKFGYSLEYRVPVEALLWPRALNTLLLTGLATLVAWMLALPWGTLEALHYGGWIDRIGGSATTLLLSIPDVLLGLLLLLLAAKTGWFPTAGMSSTSAGGGFAGHVWDVARHLVLPVLALALGMLPILARHVRSAMIVALDSSFVQAARAHGIPRRRLIYRIAFPAAMNSLISLLGFTIGGLLSMSLLIEIVLGWPGLGPLILEAMLARDVYVVMAAVMLSSVFLVAGNLIADGLLYWNDPRIRGVSA